MTLYVDGVDVSTAKDVRVDGVQAKAVYVDGVRVWSPPAAAPIAFDAAANGTGNTNWKHVITGNALIAVAVLQNNNATAYTPPSPSDVFANAAKMTLLKSWTWNGGFYGGIGNAGMGVFVFGLLAPPLGEITIDIGSPLGTVVGTGSASYSNVSSFGSANGVNDTFKGSGPAAMSAASAVGKMVFAAFGCYQNQGLTFTSFNQTARVGGASNRFIIGDAPGAASVAFNAGGASSTNSFTWGGITVPLL